MTKNLIFPSVLRSPLVLGAVIALLAIAFSFRSFAHAEENGAPEVPSPIPVTTVDDEPVNTVGENKPVNPSEEKPRPTESKSNTPSAWILHREKGSSKIWVITKDKTKREIQTFAFFSLLDGNYLIKLTESARLAELTEGTPITSIEGLTADDFLIVPRNTCKLIKGKDKPAVYLVCGSVRRVILREGVFKQNGWDFKDVKTVSAEDVAAFTEGEAVSEQTTLDIDTEVETGTTEPSTEPVKPKEHASNKEALRAKLEARFKALGKDEEKERLVKPEGYAQIYLIDKDGVKHRIVNMEAIRKHKLDLKHTTAVPAAEVSALQEGEPITEQVPVEEVEIEEEPFDIE